MLADLRCKFPGCKEGALIVEHRGFCPSHFIEHKEAIRRENKAKVERLVAQKFTEDEIAQLTKIPYKEVCELKAEVSAELELWLSSDPNQRKELLVEEFRRAHVFRVQELAIIYNTYDDAKIKLQALRQWKEEEENFLKAMQSLGEVTKKAEKVEISVEEEIFEAASSFSPPIISEDDSDYVPTFSADKLAKLQKATGFKVG